MEIIARTIATDEAEEAEFGEERVDELREQLRGPEGRREFSRQARQQLRRERDDDDSEQVIYATASRASQLATPEESESSAGRVGPPLGRWRFRGGS